MKYLSSLLLLAGLTVVRAYDECYGCGVVTTEDGIKWGVENNEWCSTYSKNKKKLILKKNFFY